MIKKIILTLLMLVTFVSCNHQVEKKTMVDIPGKNGALNLGENITEHYIFYVFRNPAKDYINREYIILTFEKGYLVDIYHSNKLTTREIGESNKSLFNYAADKGYGFIETYENNKLTRSIGQRFYVWIEYSQPRTNEYGEECTDILYERFAYNDHCIHIGGNYYNSIDKIKSENFIKLTYNILEIKDYSYYIDELTGKEVTKTTEYSKEFDLDLELN